MIYQQVLPKVRRTGMETMAVGYIRTTLYSKAVPLFGPDRMVRIRATRALNKQRKREDIEFLSAVWSGQVRYTVDWTRGQQGAFPDRVIRRLLDERKVSDMIVQKAEVFVSCPVGVDLLNAELDQRYDAMPKGTERIRFEPSDRLLLTFENNPSDEATRLAWVNELNAKARAQLSADIGVLDLTGIQTERSLKYGEKEDWSMNDTRLLRALLRTMRKEAWPEAERFVESGGVKHVAAPFAIRVYQRERADAWRLADNQEVNGGDP